MGGSVHKSILKENRIAITGGKHKLRIQIRIFCLQIVKFLSWEKADTVDFHIDWITLLIELF